MANVVFSFESFDSDGVQDAYGPLKGYEREEGVKKGNQIPMFDTEEWGDIDNLYSEYGVYPENTTEKGVLLSKDQQQTPFADFGMLDDFHLDCLSPPVQLGQETAESDTVLTGISDLVEPKKVRQYTFPLASLELLSNRGSGFKRLKPNEPSGETKCTTGSGRELSTEDVMREAAARYIQMSAPKDGDHSLLRLPYGCALVGLSDEETEDVDLAHLLLASAEKVGNQQFDRATKLLNQCDCLSSNTGNPVQRVVYYFAEALRERINRETGRTASKELDIEKAMMNPCPAILASHRELPFGQVSQLTGMQIIIENVSLAKRVHLIDLGIRSGVQWTVVMQALAVQYSCPIELLKITAVGTTSQESIVATGKRLVNFADTMNLPFSFKIVMVSDLKDLKEDMFELEADEAVAVYSPLILRTMIARPYRLETLMRVIRNLDPCIMVITEVEGNHNSPSFVNRFTEVLFYHSALFDCIESCMDRNNQYRMTIEAKYCGLGILNIVAAEGEERTNRHVDIDTWRAFFARFGMVEIELSQTSMYQARLVAKKFACGESCTLDMKGKCLLIGWKGTPIHSISAWKFH